jgi:hypothetical protein
MIGDAVMRKGDVADVGHHEARGNGTSADTPQLPVSRDSTVLAFAYER